MILVFMVASFGIAAIGVLLMVVRPTYVQLKRSPKKQQRQLAIIGVSVLSGVVG